MVPHDLVTRADDFEAIARAHGMEALWISDEGEGSLASRSDWVLVGTNKALLENSRLKESSVAIEHRPEWRLWTDDYNNLVQVLK